MSHKYSPPPHIQPEILRAVKRTLACFVRVRVIKNILSKLEVCLQARNSGCRGFVENSACTFPYCVTPNFQVHNNTKQLVVYHILVMLQPKMTA